MTDHRNDPHRYRQNLEDWRWLAAEAEAADRHEQEAREEASRAPAPRIPWWVPFALAAVLPALAYLIAEAYRA